MEWLGGAWHWLSEIVSFIAGLITRVTSNPFYIVIAAVVGFVAARIKKRRDEELRRWLIPGVELGGYSALARDDVKKLPTTLVVADYGVIPYDDSRGLLGTSRDQGDDTLLGWTARGKRVRIRLYVGGGGCGKTRLALEAVKRLRKRGWRAGFLSRDGLVTALRKPPGGEGRSPLASDLKRARGRGMLLVVDYAETRLEQVRALALELAKGSGRPVRVILLARTAQWYASFLSRLPHEQRLLFDDDPSAKVAANIAPEQRQTFFDAACAAFAGKLEAAAPRLLASSWRSIKASNIFSDDGSPIHLAFQAFLHVRGEKLTQSPLEEMAKEERRHHARALGDAPANQMRTEAVAASAALLTLSQGLVPENAKEDLRKLVRLGVGSLGEFDDDAAEAARDDVREALQHLYGREVPMRPVLPDILGECMIGQTLERAPSLLGEMLDALPHAALSALTVCNRATLPVHAHHTQDAIRNALRLVFETRLQVLAQPLVAATLADEGDIQVVAAEALRRSPEQVQIGKAIVNAAAAIVDVNAVPARLRTFFGEAATAAGGERRAIVTMPQAAEEAGARASLLSSDGKVVEALASAEEAVELYRALYADEPDSFADRLAASLNNLSNRRAESGARDGALDASSASVELYRALVKSDQERFLQPFSLALTNLGSRLADLDRREEALAVTIEAVNAGRRLVARDRNAFAPDLATTLGNLGLRLRQLGRHTEALTASREAVHLYREFVERKRDAFAHRLADALLNLSGELGLVGRRAEAVEAALEAVALCREAVSHAAVFMPNLAAALVAAANSLVADRQMDKATPCADEAVKLYRELAEARRNAFAPKLGQALNTYFVVLNNAGNAEEALAAVSEAVSLFRTLAAQDGAAFKPDLALSLNNLSLAHSEISRPEEALEEARECVGLYRELAGSRAVFLPSLSAALGTLVGRLTVLGQADEATPLLMEVVEIERKLSEKDRVHFLPSYARALIIAAANESDRGQRDEAHELTAAAITVYRELVAKDPASFRPLLAAALESLVPHLSARGQSDEANAVAQEVMSLRQS